MSKATNADCLNNFEKYPAWHLSNYTKANPQTDQQKWSLHPKQFLPIHDLPTTFWCFTWKNLLQGPQNSQICDTSQSARTPLRAMLSSMKSKSRLGKSSSGTKLFVVARMLDQNYLAFSWTLIEPLRLHCLPLKSNVSEEEHVSKTVRSRRYVSSTTNWCQESLEARRKLV